MAAYFCFYRDDNHQSEKNEAEAATAVAVMYSIMTVTAATVTSI